MAIARLYRLAQRSFTELARTLDGPDWASPSPCTPGWSVRDVLSHVAGVTLDIVDGNVEGAATEPWTAAQVERWRDTPVGDLLDRWDRAIDRAAEGIELIGEGRPVFDCHTHEHDVRTALARPGNRESEIVTWAAAGLTDTEFSRRLRFELADGSVLECDGPGRPLTVAGLTRFELFRARVGRRSADQVRAWRWSEPVGDDLLREWFVFGPAAVDIVE